MSRNPSPEANWGKDNSSLVLGEQAKALPAAITKPIATDESDRDAAVRAATGKGTTELLQQLTEAEQTGKTFLTTYVNPARERSYKAFRNEHFQGSKYLGARYKTRSKLFKPKTRSAVRKSMASAAGALFASADVVCIEAQDTSDPKQRASADLKQELLNYRLERTNGRDSIPWFLVSMGAHQDATLGGICVSKQYWKFRERVKKQGDDYEQNADPITQITIDRPDSLNIASENVIIDPNCEWTRPAQTSAYLIVRYPMPIHEVMSMMRPSHFKTQADWIEYDEATLLTLAGASPDDVKAVRDARSSGADGQQVDKTTGAYRVLWVYENFLHINGEDIHFWSIGNQKLLSVPRCTYESYPEFYGERPYVIGFGALETHRPIPMAPAESWQQLQQEANDITNLRLDQMKQVVTPVTKVKRGRQVDLEQVMRRGQDTVLMLTDLEDVEFDRPPDVPASAYQEAQYLNNDFDELAGVFSQGSVQSNRSLNETVGGMKLLSGAANSVTEFDLRVWVETWVEPVLYQLVKLEEYYESDEKILALAGQKAELIEKYGIDQITDHLLMQDVTLRVSAGIGAADPMQGLDKFNNAATIASNIIMPFMQAGLVSIRPKTNEIVDEVFGKAGYKGAFERFFEEVDQQQQAPQPDPTKMAELQLKAQIEDTKAKLAERKMQIDAAGKQADGHDKAAERDLKIRLANLEHRYRLMEQGQQLAHQAREAHTDRIINTATTLHGSEREDAARQADRQAQVEDRDHGRRSQLEDRYFDREDGDADRSFQAEQKGADRGHKEQLAGRQAQQKRLEGLSQRTHQAQEASSDREFQHAQAAHDRQHQAGESQADRTHQSRQASAERTHTRNQSSAERTFQREEAGAARQFQAKSEDAARKFQQSEAQEGRKHQTVLAKMTAGEKAKQAGAKGKAKPKGRK
jgi:hypothetical protein